LLKRSIYDQAPDLVSLEVLSPEDEVSSGFVSLESLLKHQLSTRMRQQHGVEVVGAD
jgi:hypothetical protein